MESIKRIYANGININYSVYDFIIDFNLIDPNGNEPTDCCKIFLSPQHAKAFSMILDNNIKLYEKNIGEIFLPPNVIDALQPQQNNSKDEVV